jgi:soluble lytic murein transglycosylase-like protein
VKRRIEREHPIREEAPGREGLRALLRRPGVRLLLVLAAAGQVVAVQQAGRVGNGTDALVSGDLAPVVVTASNAGTVGAAWEAAALNRESARIAAKYRAEGYPVTETLASLIHSVAVEKGIEPEVAFGLVRAESSFRTTATSPVGAVGLTQLMPKTAAWLSPGTSRMELRDPETNIRIGFGYLRQLIDKYEGDVDLALVAYNRGPGTVDRALKRGRNPNNGYSAFVRGEENHGHSLYTR